MSGLIAVFHARQAQWAAALLEHLEISLTALILAVVIAIPLALLVIRHRRLTEGVLQLTGIFQTIPSLALLGLFIPFMGIGRVPAITALTLYGIFPVLQNTVTGFRQIDPELEEAAEAFGMTSLEKLRIYRLALAMPVIVAGIRTAAVMIIGTATLAALIGAGGLGSFILLGIDRNDSSLILLGALSAALLAVVFNYAVKALERLSARKVAAVFLAVVLATGFALVPAGSIDGFGGLGGLIPERRTVVVAGKLGPEPEILINMYKLLIEGKSDIHVKLRPNFGKTSFLYEALKSGDIDIYPEFTGTITSSLLKGETVTSTDPRQVYELARDGILKQDNLVLLEPMAYENTYAIAVRSNFAHKYELKDISDLVRVEDRSRAGFSLEFEDRADGGRGLRRVYGLELDVATMEPSLKYEALLKDDVQIIEVYSTDSEIRQYHLAVLADDRHLFPPYQGAPLLRKDTLEKYPELAPILNTLAGKITDAEMAEMNYRVKVEKIPARQVAGEYLRSHGLL